MYYYATPSHRLLQENKDEDAGDGDSTAACFSSAAEYHAAVWKNRQETAVQVKEQALAAFKKRKVIVIANDGNDADDEQLREVIAVVDNKETVMMMTMPSNDSDNYQYIVTIPSSKTTVMTLVLRFISNGVTFRTA